MDSFHTKQLGFISINVMRRVFQRQKQSEYVKARKKIFI